MIIAVISSEKNVDSRAAGAFGRTGHIFVADTESRVIKILDVAKVTSLPAGSEVETARLLLKIGVDRVAAESIGREAREVLSCNGVRVFTGISGSAREIIDYLAAGGTGG